MDYEPGMGSKPLFPKMHLETCEGTVSSVRTTVELQTGHIGKGCDRETYSEKSLQKLCGEFNSFIFMMVKRNWPRFTHVTFTPVTNTLSRTIL